MGDDELETFTPLGLSAWKVAKLIAAARRAGHANASVRTVIPLVVVKWPREAARADEERHSEAAEKGADEQSNQDTEQHQTLDSEKKATHPK